MPASEMGDQVILRYLTGSRRNQTLWGIWRHTHYEIARAAWEHSGIEPLQDVVALPTGRLYLRYWTLVPDLVIADFGNHYYDVRSGAGGCIDRIVELATEARKTKNLKTAALCMHYVADLGQPLHTASCPAEKKIHSTAETDVRRCMDRKPEFFQFERPAERYAINNLPVWLKGEATITNKGYDAIIRAYSPGGRGLYECYPAMLAAYQHSCRMCEAVSRWIYAPEK